MGDDPATRPGPPPPLPAAGAGSPVAEAVACANHRDRRAIGRCPACRRLVCDECHVRLDGILHCKSCLAVEARRLEQPTRRSFLPRVGTVAAAAVVGLLAYLAVRGALTSAGFLGGRATRWFATTFETSHPEQR